MRPALFAFAVLARQLDHKRSVLAFFHSLENFLHFTSFCKSVQARCVAAQIAGRLGRFRSWAVMTVSLVVGGLGTVAMGLLTSSVPLFMSASLFAGLGLGMAWAYTNVVTQSIVPPEKAGAASGLVLTILIGMGGVAVAGAASLTATGTGQGGATTDVLGMVLIGFGILALVCAPLVILFGRQAPSPHTNPDSSARVGGTQR